MPPPPLTVSVLAPLTPALERVKAMLFRPFALDKWLIIGFAAWLAHLGRANGSFPGLRFGGGRGAPLRSVLEQAREYVVNNLSWIVPLAAAIGFGLLVLWLVFLWLNSRGQFLFLHCTALNRAEILEPWSRFGRQADSLFLFRAALGLIHLGLNLPLVIWGIWTVNQMITTPEGPLLGPVLRLLAVIAGIAAMAVAFSVVRFLMIDFVVPVMFLHRTRCLAAWRALLGVLASNILDFVLFGLFSLVLTIAIGLATATLVLATCCLAGCLLAIPYIGTVALLPVLAFRRCYSLYYLAQFGPDWDVFAQPGPAAPVSGSV